MTRLSDFATAPLYNIKAVVQATNISPSTLRAWERRYEFCTPHRSKSGYRLYSDQDIAVIQWLKQQVDSGMAISQAVSWYQTLVDDGETLEHVVLPTPNHDRSTATSLASTPSAPAGKPASFERLHRELLEALIAYREAEAEQIMAEALGYYQIEANGEKLITPVLVEIGTRWHNGLLSIAREHFATNFFRQYLLSILRGTRQNQNGKLLWIGCPPEEQHEISIIMLSVYLKRAGFQVRYLGQNLPLDELADDIDSEQPAMLLLSASTLQSVPQLEKLTQNVAELNRSKIIIGYGGRIFNHEPELRKKIAGVYLGETVLQAAETVDTLLTNGIMAS